MATQDTFHLYLKYRVGKTGARDTDFTGPSARAVGNQARTWYNARCRDHRDRSNFPWRRSAADQQPHRQPDQLDPLHPL